jgi:hypothetical protein
MLDPEGVAIVNPNNFLISSEGFVPIIPPSLYLFNTSGVLESTLEIPNKFMPKGVPPFQTRGTGHNEAFECLTISNDKNVVYLAPERPLKQDKYKNGDEKVTRIIRYEKQNGNFVATKEFGYQLGDVGLVDFVPLSKNKLLTLERGFDYKTKKQSIYIFEAFLENATDLSKIRAINSIKNIKLVKKNLLLDLDSIIPKLSKKHRKLDNFEGITLGPKLPNGNQSVIIVSDNNFRKQQRTAFFLFELSFPSN